MGLNQGRIEVLGGGGGGDKGVGEPPKIFSIPRSRYSNRAVTVLDSV